LEGNTKDDPTTFEKEIQSLSDEALFRLNKSGAAQSKTFLAYLGK